MGADKLRALLRGEPVLAHTLRAFELCPAVHAIVLVGPATLRRTPKVTQIVPGGARRQDSVRAGLEALDHTFDVVAVHDGARPLLSPDLIARGIVLAREHGAAVPVLPLFDTIKRVDSEGRVQETPSRAELRAAQTPQSFRLELLRRAHAASDEDATDDAQLVERLGHPVLTYPGDRRNIKITTPEDLLIAEALLRCG